MKVVINASTVRIGGGLQATHSFLSECRVLSGHTFHVFLSAKMSALIDRSLYPGNFMFYDIKASSASMQGRRQLRRELSALERRIRPDVVFTIFGPPYWRPQARHICGFAKAQYLYKDSPFFKIITLKQSLLLKLKERFHISSFKNDCDVLVVETEDVQKLLMQRLPGKPVHTVSNTCHQVFDDENKWSYAVRLPASDAFTLLTVSAYYIHKNLSIIPAVIEYLVKQYPGFAFRFVLTFNAQQLPGITAMHLPYLHFTGKVDIADCPALYRQADAMFLPTLLECFSVSYAEAMKMDRMVLTSDLSFARNICRDAALYFDPLSPQSIGNTIYKAATDVQLKEQLLHNGRQRLHQFLSAKERAAAYLKIIEECHETGHEGSFYIQEKINING